MSRIADLAYATGWSLVRHLPESTADRLFRAGADAVSRRDGARRRQLRANLRRVRPEADDHELDLLVRDGMRSYARYWREAFRLPSMDHDGVHRRIESTVEGVEHLDAALARGRGVVAALPHTGNWDAAGVWLARRLGGFTTVAARLRPESLYQRFVSYRRSLGFDILPLTGDARLVTGLTGRLRANGVVCLLSDLDLTDSGVEVPFFGEPALLPSGPVRLARSTGATLLPVATWFTTLGWGVRFHPPITVEQGADGVPATVRRLAEVFAGDIAAHPWDWHMLQPLWCADRAGG